MAFSPSTQTGALAKSSRMTESGTFVEDPFVYWARRLLKSRDSTVFRVIAVGRDGEDDRIVTQGEIEDRVRAADARLLSRRNRRLQARLPAPRRRRACVMLPAAAGDQDEHGERQQRNQACS